MPANKMYIVTLKDNTNWVYTEAQLIDIILNRETREKIQTWEQISTMAEAHP